jgi:hypothetical protein
MSDSTLISQLSVIRDFRQHGKVQHELIDVFLAITAVISDFK